MKSPIILFLVLSVCLVSRCLGAEVSITLTPADANAAGARWRIDSGQWQESGALVKSVSRGSHNISYAQLTGWEAPAAEVVTVPNKGTLALSRTYTIPTGTLYVDATPAAAVASGVAKYRVDSGDWLLCSSGPITLPEGDHFVEFMESSGWISPAAAAVTIAANEQTNLNVEYREIPTGTLFVDATPAPAIALGVAKFRVDGGEWLLCSSAPLTLTEGTHSVEFMESSGWISPAAATVAITADEQTILDVQYLYRHRLRVFLNENLIGGLTVDEVRIRIAQYVVHIQTIFHGQTLRRLEFDPANGIEFCSTSPFSNSYTGVLPEIGYEIWIYAQLSQNPTFGTYGGYAGLDESGAGGARDLYWDKIHDPSTIIDGTTDAMQYWRQIDHIVHEFEHAFGAGFGEYYTAAGQRDETGVDPILATTPAANGISTAPFWDEHQAYWADPLTADAWGNPRLGYPTSISQLLSLVEFGPATKGVVNGLYRANKINAVPDLSAVRVRVVDAAGFPIQGATVRVWNRLPPGTQPGTSSHTEYPVQATAEPNVFTFTWAPYPHVSIFSNYENLKLIKAWAPGHTPKARWEWVYAAQERKTLFGEETFEVTMQLDPL